MNKQLIINSQKATPSPLPPHTQVGRYYYLPNMASVLYESFPYHKDPFLVSMRDCLQQQTLGIPRLFYAIHVSPKIYRQIPIIPTNTERNVIKISR